MQQQEVAALLTSVQWSCGAQANMLCYQCQAWQQRHMLAHRTTCGRKGWVHLQCQWLQVQYLTLLLTNALLACASARTKNTSAQPLQNTYTLILQVLQILQIWQIWQSRVSHIIQLERPRG